MDRAFLESAIAELVQEYEKLHSCEISSLWVEHHMGSMPTVEVTVTERPRIAA